MDIGTIAIRAGKDYITSVSYSPGILTLGINRFVITGTCDILDIHDLMNDAYGKSLVRVEFTSIPYDEEHPFEGRTTYFGGVEEWNVYQTFTFHFDDETFFPLEVCYGSPEGHNPTIICELP